VEAHISGIFGVNRLKPGCGLVSPDEPPRGSACPGVGNEFSDNVVGHVEVGEADGDQSWAMPVFRAGMRPFGYGFCDGLLARAMLIPSSSRPLAKRGRP
jgi:hypothetical protein